MTSERNRPTALGQSKPFVPPGGAELSEVLRTGRGPEWVGRRVRAAVENDEAYIFTHPATRSFFDARAAGVRAGFDAADRYGDG
jgi:hypothetical protein